MYKKSWEKRNPEKVTARLLVYAALKKGILYKAPCEVCGSKKVQGHHEDYSKPLKVRWLCPKHHKMEHRKYD